MQARGNAGQRRKCRPEEMQARGIALPGCHQDVQRPSSNILLCCMAVELLCLGPLMHVLNLCWHHHSVQGSSAPFAFLSAPGATAGQT
jgi:hypothetical protein